MVDQVFKHENLLRDLPRIWDRVDHRLRALFKERESVVMTGDHGAEVKETLGRSTISPFL